MFKFLLFLLLLKSTLMCAQIKGADIVLGVTFDYLDYKEFSPKSAIGINGEIMLSKHFGVELSLSGSQDYFSYGIASLVTPVVVLLAYSTRKIDNGNGAAFMALLLIIPAFLEQTNFYIPINANIQLIPYISVYKFKYLYNNNIVLNYDRYASAAVGTKLRLMTKKGWHLSANFELRNLYSGIDDRGFNSTNLYGHQVGISFGYIFKDHSRE